MSPPVEITKDTITPWLSKTKAELEKLAHCEIRVGILSSQDGELLKIARVHEFGATITPKAAKNLAIPLKPSMKDKSPRDVANTWIYDNGENRFIVRDMGGDRLEFLFLLVPKVTIPERSFIRAGYDHGKDRLTQAVKQAIADVIAGDKTAEQAANYVGVIAVGLIKRYMQTVQPLKSRVTLASAPNKTQTLVQSGRLREAITYEVVW